MQFIPIACADRWIKGETKLQAPRQLYQTNHGNFDGKDKEHVELSELSEGIITGDTRIN